MNRVAANAVKAITEHALAAGPKCGRVTVVAIDGHAGAGKTTLAGALAYALESDVIHMDDLYEGWGGLSAAAETLADGILQPLSRDQSGSYRRYDWYRGDFAEIHQVIPAKFLIVEGVGSVRRANEGYYSTIVWLEVDERTRRERAFTRDGAELEKHWSQWSSDETALFAAEQTRSLADIEVDAWGRTKL